MPDLQSSLDAAGAVTQALLKSLDLVQQHVAASQIGPDGKPSTTAMYMQLPMGITIDPTMYANAWTPGAADTGSGFDNSGTFIQSAAPAAAAPAGAPAGSVYAPPQPQPDQQLPQSIQNAMYLSALVDNMLEVTDQGVASSWADRQVSVEYFTVLSGMTPSTTETPNPAVVARVKAAQAVLYIQDANGNAIGYTPLYAQYIRNRKAWTDAIGAQAAAYWQAMSDPAIGRAWPVTAATYANTTKQALDDLNGMGRQQVEAALNTIATAGQDATTALIALAKQMYDSFTIQLGGAVSVGVPWSYVNPVRWWDSADESLGVQSLTVSSSAQSSSGGTGSSSFANNWFRQQSSSVGGSVGVHFGPFGASANASHTQASNAAASKADQSNWAHHADRSSNASISFEYFVAEITRPWLLGDLFHIDGWYLQGHRKNDISDGTVKGQIDDQTKILPLLPMAFVIMRNVSITADDWGEAGNDFQNAQQTLSNSGQSSASSYGGSIGYLGISGSASAARQQSSGAFGAAQTSNTGFSFTKSGNGGTLQIHGSQIVGWIGQIQPASPSQDDPMLPKQTTPAAQTTQTTQTTQPAQPAQA